MQVFLATDHAGYELKEFVKNYLINLEYEVIDCGAYELDPVDDYPDYIIPAAKKVANNIESRGIIFGGSGQGEAMAANRVNGVRAALYYGGSLDIVKLSRTHNNANILSIGARFLSYEKTIEVISLWIKEPFEGGRHLNRISKLDKNYE